MVGIEFREVTFGFNSENPLLRGFSFEIQCKGVHSIIGRSGIGKTTLLRLIAGLLPPQFGEVDIAPRGARISMVSQYPSLLPFRTVRGNLKLAVKVFGTESIYAFAVEMLGRFKLLNALDKYPSELSGGMKARVSLVKALSVKPQILLLDEPFANIDEVNKNVIVGFLREFIEEHNVVTVMVTHNIMDALFFSDRIYLFLDSPASGLSAFSFNEPSREVYSRVVAALERKVCFEE